MKRAMDMSDFQMFYKTVCLGLEELDPMIAEAVLGVMVDIVAAKKHVTPMELLDELRELAESVYRRLGDYPLSKETSETLM